MDELDLLPAPWRETFELMWEAYVAGTIPVGAVVAGVDDVVVSRGRNRIFGDRVAEHLGGTRLAHAEINALVGLSSDAVYEGLTLYTALEPCHLCLAAATTARVGRVTYAGADRYGGAVGMLLPSEDMLAHPIVVEGPRSGVTGLLPELLHLRHMLWRVPGSNVARIYRDAAPELIERALQLPSPDEASTLDEAFAAISV